MVGTSTWLGILLILFKIKSLRNELKAPIFLILSISVSLPLEVPGEFHLNHLFSYSQTLSANDAILLNLTVKNLQHLIMQFTWLNLAVQGLLCPPYFCLLVFKLNNLWNIDNSKLIGCSVVCAASKAFSTFMESEVKSQSKSPQVMHY